MTFISTCGSSSVSRANWPSNPVICRFASRANSASGDNCTALASSKNEARRLVAQRGVRLNGRTVEDPEEVYRPADGDVWQVGRRRYVRVRLGAS